MVNVNSNLNFLLDHNNIDLKEVHKTIYGFDPMKTVYLTGFPQRQKEYGELYVNDIKEIFKVSVSAPFNSRSFM